MTTDDARIEAIAEAKRGVINLLRAETLLDLSKSSDYGRAMQDALGRVTQAKRKFETVIAYLEYIDGRKEAAT